MTLQEFKAWFDGFTEGFSGKAPTQKQWKRIQERVAEINGASVERHYIERHWPYWYVSTPSYYSSPTITTLLANGTSDVVATDTVTAMYSLGKAEAEAWGG